MAKPGFTLKAESFEATGPGLIRMSGSFALSGTTPTALRPKIGNFTVTRMAAGVYVVTYVQPMKSVVTASAQIGDSSGASGNALRTGVGGYVWMSQDWMTTNANGTQYLADTTFTKQLILSFNTALSALVDLPANTRCSFDSTLASSALNF
jgi:hypothetical protein